MPMSAMLNSAIMLTDDTGIRTLNSNWRGIDKPTNVLSFPALQPAAGGTGRRAAHARRYRHRLRDDAQRGR